jgi:hypothetical protein
LVYNTAARQRMAAARHVNIQHEKQQQQQQLELTDGWQLGWCIIHCGCMMRAVTHSVV